MKQYFDMKIEPLVAQLDRALANKPQYRYIPAKVVPIHQIDVTYIEVVDEYVPDPLGSNKLAWKPF